MKNTEESESSGSRAAVDSPSQENPRHYRMKLEVFGKVLQRLQESSYEEAALPDFEDQLWQHFNRLSPRYALDLKVERAEDVLTHLRLLKLAEDPATRPVFEVRNVQVSPRNSDPALEDDAQSFSKPHEKGVLSTPTFASSPNFEAITQGSKFVDSAVNATLATRPMHQITFSTIDKPEVITQLTSLLSELGLNIQEAHVFSTADGFSLNVFVVDGWSQEETEGLKDALGNEILKLKKLVTKTQQTFDRALSTLPVTQHGMIWESYLVFVSQEGVPVETSLSVYRRYEDYIELLLKSGRGLEAAENLINALSRVGEVGILWTSTVEHLICVLSEWAQMELRHMNLRSDTAGPSVQFRQRATDTDMEDSVPVRIGMGGKVRSGRRKIKSVSNKPATMSTKKYTPDDQEWPRDLPEHFVEIGKDWRNTPFIIRPAAYQGLLDLCWAVCISRSVESAFNLLEDGREPVRLSAQHLVNGVHKHETGYITHFDGVRDFMQRHGMVPEASCPWTGKADKKLGCTHEHVEDVYRVNDLVYLDKVVEKDLILLLQKQPILAVMEYCPELEDHREGIYDGPRTRSTSNKNNKSTKKMKRSGLHVVEVLGYNTDTAGETEGKHYWLVQMASGTEWGVDGVGKVMRQISRKEDKSLFVSALYTKVGLREA